MKIRFLKQHIDNNEGDIVEVDEDKARYWIGCGVVEFVKEKVMQSHTEKQKDIKPQAKSKR